MNSFWGVPLAGLDLGNTDTVFNTTFSVQPALVPRPKMHLTRFSGVFAPHYKHRALVVLKPKTPPELPGASATQPTKSRITWARLLKRVFGIDVETCHSCSGKTKIIAAIEDPQVIKKILIHLGLPAQISLLH